jgi:hypothetical protein
MKQPGAKPMRERYRGMTVNERLVVAGLLEQFDAATRRRDRAAMMALLAQVDLDPEQAALTTETVLANPKRYGY